MKSDVNNKILDDNKLADYLSGNSYLSKRHKLFYIATPKVACTSLKWWIADLDGVKHDIEEYAFNSFESTSELAIHDTYYKVSPETTGLSKNKLIEALTDEDYFRFAVVRNPFTRLFSAWQSKLLLREPFQSKNYLNHEFFNHHINSIDDIAKAFEKFLDHLAENEAPDFWDLHWTPQSMLLRPDVIDYTKISKLEDTKDLSDLLRNHLGKNFKDPFQIKHSNESLIPFIPEIISTRSVEIIQNLYSNDFETFEYSNIPPVSSIKFSDYQFKIALKAIKLISERNKKLAEHNVNVPKLNEHISIYELSNQELKNSVNNLEKTIIEKENKIMNLVDDLKIRNHEIQEIQNSKIYRFINCLSNEPIGLRKIYTLVRIFAGMVVPKKVKKILISFKNKKINTTKFQSDNKPKVLHVIANFMLGGSSRLVVDIINDLENYHHEVVTYASPQEPAYPEISAYEYRPGLNESEFESFLDSYSADIVHIHYWGDCDEPWYDKVYQLVKDKKCKIIENINTPVEPYKGVAIHKYIYVSDYVKTVFGQPNEKSITIYPGSDFELFNNLEINNVVDDCIGMVYRLENDKLNHDSIKPFIDVVKKRPQTKVIIVGGGANLEIYKKLCKDADVLSAFTFTDYVAYETLPEWYKKMSIFVAPVWKESFGQVSPFAMNMGLPVVGYNIGALSEIIGNSELLAEYGDSEKLSNIIIDLLDDRERRLEIGAYNKLRAQERFSVQAMTNSYQAIYDDLMVIDK